MKTTVLIILLIAVALAVAFFVFSKPSYPLTEGDAQKYFVEDLKEKYPSADVREVMEILPQTASDGTPYYQLKARVTTGLSTPCPERIHVYYDYPPKNFVNQPPEYITRGCKVCLNVQVCTLAFPEEAIIASHTYNGTEAVSQFLLENSDAAATASFDGAGTWTVSWSSASSGKGYTVALSKSQNKVINVTSSG
ncbi:Uncharacterised protein [uncultured archaeon]|nr:Uncharacterised protein [uncultured archaeon]